MIRKIALLFSLFFISGTALALPLASGKIVDGSTFGTSNAFYFTNDSDSGESITQITWDLTAINGFFDTTPATPGQGSSGLIASTSSDPVGYVFPDNASVDGSSILTIDFTDFGQGETFQFGVDTDYWNAIDALGIDGSGFIGSFVIATFSDGTQLSGIYEATTQIGFGSEVTIGDPYPATPGTPPPPGGAVPLPSTLWLFLAGGLALLRVSRR